MHACARTHACTHIQILRLIFSRKCLVAEHLAIFMNITVAGKYLKAIVCALNDTEYFCSFPSPVSYPRMYFLRCPPRVLLFLAAP